MQSIMTYSDPFQGFPGGRYSEMVYHHLLLGAPWDCAALPKAMQASSVGRRQSGELNSQLLAPLGLNHGAIQPAHIHSYSQVHMCRILSLNKWVPTRYTDKVWLSEGIVYWRHFRIVQRKLLVVAFAWWLQTDVFSEREMCSLDLIFHPVLAYSVVAQRHVCNPMLSVPSCSSLIPFDPKSCALSANFKDGL